jgi:plastocyanin
MKKIVTTCIGVALVFTYSFATKHTINTESTTFSPALTEINLGDTVVFNVGGGHTATEVSQSTWNANGTTPAGIFNFSSGSNQQVVGLTVGTHYYVCQVHVGMGMKGQITVANISGTKQNETAVIKLFPNPAKDFIQWDYKGIDLTRVSLVSADGKSILNWNNGNKITSISISGLPAGLYFLEGYAGDKKIWIEKFQKQ